MVKVVTAVVISSLLIFTYIYFNNIYKSGEQIKKLPVIYNLGVNFDDFDPETGYVGSFLFDKNKCYFDKVFTEFGINHPHKTESLVVQYIYHLPKGTPLVALADGVVADIRYQSGLRENDDFEIMLTFKDAPGWKYGFDHITNLKVKLGKEVRVGDILAEAPGGPKSNPNIFSSVELTILEEGSSNEEIENHCPFKFLEVSKKTEFTRKLNKFFADWEIFMNNPNIYDETKWVYPGCYFGQINEAAGLMGKNKL